MTGSPVLRSLCTFVRDDQTLVDERIEQFRDPTRHFLDESTCSLFVTSSYCSPFLFCASARN
jgi:hypothetical protein